jgi:hypothetical protein
VPPAYPDITSTTPGTCSRVPSIHQKHPPAKYAFATVPVYVLTVDVFIFFVLGVDRVPVYVLHVLLDILPDRAEVDTFHILLDVGTEYVPAYIYAIVDRTTIHTNAYIPNVSRDIFFIEKKVKSTYRVYTIYVMDILKDYKYIVHRG